MQVDELPSYTIVAAATNHPELWIALLATVSNPIGLTSSQQRELARYKTHFFPGSA